MDNPVTGQCHQWALGVVIYGRPLKVPSIGDDVTPVDLDLGGVDAWRLRHGRTLGGVPRRVVSFTITCDVLEKCHKTKKCHENEGKWFFPCWGSHFYAASFYHYRKSQFVFWRRFLYLSLSWESRLMKRKQLFLSKEN